MKNVKALNVVLVLLGLVIISMGLNVGLGGMRTLGMQGPTDFISVVDAAAFHAQDSHIRFIAGVWFGVGAVFLLGGFQLEKFRMTLVTLSLMIAFAGLFRFSDWDSGVVFSAAIIPSLVFELIGLPLLAWWLLRSAKETDS